MTIASQIRLGIDFLLRCQTSDGGIAATSPGQSSGSWTTAATLSALVHSPEFPRERDDQLREMVRYLLDARIPRGGWPMARNSANASPMATGHSMEALFKAKCLYPSGSAIIAEIEASLKESAAWLISTQNQTDGGWGIDPMAQEGRDSRVLSTVYAIRGFIGIEENAHKSSHIQKAASFLTSLVNDDGGCGSFRTAPSDACSTARMIHIMIESKSLSHESQLIRRAVKYLEKCSKSWVVMTEKFLVHGAPGMITYHGNTPYDVIMALLSSGGSSVHVARAITYCLKAQSSVDGSWRLLDGHSLDRAISTWPTAEAIEVLDRSCKALGSQDAPQEFSRTAVLLIATIIFVIISVIETFILFDVGRRMESWWVRQSEVMKYVVVIGGIVGVAASFIASVIFAGANNLRIIVSRAIDSFLHKYRH